MTAMKKARVIFYFTVIMGAYLGRLFDLDEAHATVASDGEALVVAETWDLHACLRTCLQQHNPQQYSSR